MWWTMGGNRGRLLRFWPVGRVARGGYRSGCTVPISRRVVLGTVGAARGGGNTAVEDWFDVPTPWAGWIGAQVFCFRVRAGAVGRYSRVLVSRFDMATPLTIVALLGGRGGVGSFDDIAATKDQDSGDIGQGLPFFGWHMYHD